MPSVTLSDAELDYREFGTGPEVVVAAQMHFPSHGYTAALAADSNRYRVFEITLRGYGNSSPVTEDLGREWYPTWARDVYEATRVLGLDQFVYSGVSHGSGVGWHLALEHPEALKALVAIVGAPHSRTGGLESSSGRRQMLDANDDPAALRESILSVFPVVSNDPKRLQEHSDFIDRRIDRALADQARWNQGKPLPQATTDEELADVLSGVSVPTLLIGGMQDTIISPEMIVLAGRSVPRATTVLFQDYGHELSSLNPRAINDLIEMFLSGLASGLETP